MLQEEIESSSLFTVRCRHREVLATASQPVSQPASQSASQPASQSASQPASQPASPGLADLNSPVLDGATYSWHGTHCCNSLPALLPQPFPGLLPVPPSLPFLASLLTSCHEQVQQPHPAQKDGPAGEPGSAPFHPPPALLGGLRPSLPLKQLVHAPPQLHHHVPLPDRRQQPNTHVQDPLHGQPDRQHQGPPPPPPGCPGAE